MYIFSLSVPSLEDLNPDPLPDEFDLPKLTKKPSSPETDGDLLIDEDIEYEKTPHHSLQSNNVESRIPIGESNRADESDRMVPDKDPENEDIKEPESKIGQPDEDVFVSDDSTKSDSTRLVN